MGMGLMDQLLNVDNNDKYKSYIQRRRVGENDSVADYTKDIKKDKSPIADLQESSIFKDSNRREDSFSHFSKRNENILEYNPVKDYTIPPPSKGTYRRDPYRSNYTSAYKGANGTEIENNKTASLATKIIKQSLVCFAILGVIVILQQRNDTIKVLDFLKKHIVDNHIDFKGIVAGVGNVIAECSKIFKGTP